MFGWGRCRSGASSIVTMRSPRSAIDMIARARVVLPEDVPPETRMLSFSVTARCMRFARSPASASARSFSSRLRRCASTSTSAPMRKPTSCSSRMRETYLRIDTDTPASIAGGTMTCTRMDWPKTWTRPETMGWWRPSWVLASPARCAPSVFRRSGGIVPSHRSMWPRCAYSTQMLRSGLMTTSLTPSSTSRGLSGRSPCSA